MELIRWTDEEIKLLAKEIAARRYADPTPSMTSIYKEVEEAVLPKDRRRGINTITLAPKLEEAVRAEYERIKVESAVQVPVILPDESKLKASEVARQLTDAELIHECVKRFQSMLAGIGLAINRANMSAIAAPPPERIVAPPPAADGSGTDKVTVALIGPMRDQFNIIERKCAELDFNLVFCDKDDIKLKVPTKADYVVLMSRFMHHAQIDAVKDNPLYRNRIISVPSAGGITAICKALAELRARIAMPKAV